jgi:hypothetical protein
MQALSLAEGLTANPNNISRVAIETSQDAASWAFTQWSLRRSARSKFTRADRMLFTKEALEQATHEQVAAYHASRFPAGVLVADLTAGIGADFMALARRGPTLGFEIDPERAQCARHNASLVGDEINIQAVNCLDAPWTFEYAFADPSRRAGGRRLLKPQDFAPDPKALAERFRPLHLAALKLSPMLPDAYLGSFGGSLEFVSFRGECREALVWLGKTSRPSRQAVLVGSEERLDSGEAPQQMDTPERFILEADPAAIRGHCLGALCAQQSLIALGDSNGYLTGAREVFSPWLTCYEVCSPATGDLKKLQRFLLDAGAAAVEVKSRAPGIAVEVLKRRLSRKGVLTHLVCAFPLGSAVRFVVVKRCPSQPSQIPANAAT